MAALAIVTKGHHQRQREENAHAGAFRALQFHRTTQALACKALRNTARVSSTTVCRAKQWRRVLARFSATSLKLRTSSAARWALRSIKSQASTLRAMKSARLAQHRPRPSQSQHRNAQSQPQCKRVGRHEPIVGRARARCQARRPASCADSSALPTPLAAITAMPSHAHASGTWSNASQPSSVAKAICTYR